MTYEFDFFIEGQQEEAFKLLINMMHDECKLNKCLHDLNSHDWAILYKAVIEVEAGL